MKIKRSDLKLETFTMLACNIISIPSEKKVSTEALKNIPVDFDFDILSNKSISSKFQVILEFSSNEIENPLPGYVYSLVCRADFNLKGFSKKNKQKQDQFVLFSALPLAIAMVRSHLYTATSNFLHGHYMLPSIDLMDLFEKKFGKPAN